MADLVLAGRLFRLVQLIFLLLQTGFYLFIEVGYELCHQTVLCRCSS